MTDNIKYIKIGNNTYALRDKSLFGDVRPTENTIADYVGQKYKTSFGETWVCDSINTVSVNGTITGSPKIYNGVLLESLGNDFSYITTGITPTSSQSWEIITKVYIFPKHTFRQNITIIGATAGTKVVYIGFADNKLRLFNGTQFSSGGVTELSANKWYWIKTYCSDTSTTNVEILEDNNYTLETLPTSGWTSEISWNYNLYSEIGIRIRHNGGQIAYSPIDLKVTQISIDDSVVYTGTSLLSIPTYSWSKIGDLTNESLFNTSIVIGNKIPPSRNSVTVGYDTNNTSSENICIGANTTSSSLGSISLGRYANTSGNYSIAIGYNSKGNGLNAIGILGQATGENGIVLGYGASSESNSFHVAIPTSSTTRATDEASGLYMLLNSSGKIPGDRMSLQDASSPTTSTVGSVGQFYIDTTNQDAYICVKADTTTPEYIWKKITA